MQVKAADSKQPDIKALEVLLGRPDVGPKQSRITQQLRAIKAGERGEREVAYEIEFHYRDDPEVMTIHDLRLECDGRVAQIDHLIINRLLQFWMCESKSVGEGVEINEHGEWMAYYGGEPVDIASPIEQNKKHALVLRKIFAKGLLTLPEQRVSTLRPDIKGVVVLPKHAGILRPRSRSVSLAEGLDYVIKADQLCTRIEREGKTIRAAVGATLVSRETVQSVARQLAALHTPMNVDWAARFGLRSEPWAAVPAIPLGPPRRQVPNKAAPRPEAVSKGTRAVCTSCGRSVSEAVVSYCRANASRFKGGIFCVSCQKKFMR